jgi:hypothetical protein
MTAVIDIIDCSWEEQDLDLGLALEDHVTNEEPVMEAPIIKEVPAAVEAPLKMISAREFIVILLKNNYKSYSAQKNLKPWEKKIKCIDLARDTNITRIDAIRMILDGRAILKGAIIDWRGPLSAKFTENDPSLRDHTKWFIITEREKWAREDELLAGAGYHVSHTKSQLKKLGNTTFRY